MNALFMMFRELGTRSPKPHSASVGVNVTVPPCEYPVSIIDHGHDDAIAYTPDAQPIMPLHRAKLIVRSHRSAIAECMWIPKPERELLVQAVDALTDPRA